MQLLLASVRYLRLLIHMPGPFDAAEKWGGGQRGRGTVVVCLFNNRGRQARGRGIGGSQLILAFTTVSCRIDPGLNVKRQCSQMKRSAK